MSFTNLDLEHSIASTLTGYRFHSPHAHAFPLRDGIHETVHLSREAECYVVPYRSGYLTYPSPSSSKTKMQCILASYSIQELQGGRGAATPHVFTEQECAGLPAKQSSKLSRLQHPPQRMQKPLPCTSVSFAMEPRLHRAQLPEKDAFPFVFRHSVLQKSE